MKLTINELKSISAGADAVLILPDNAVNAIISAELRSGRDIPVGGPA